MSNDNYYLEYDYITKSTPSERVKTFGHRAFIGGSNPERWYGIGKRQYHFLTNEGLESQHKFLDIGCGSLRLGQYLIPLLGTGNYYGLEPEQELVVQGFKNEMLFSIHQKKEPKFAFNYDFNFEFCESYDYAIAQSVFTHITLEDIRKCFKNLLPISHKDSKFYFTFFEGSEAKNEYDYSDANLDFFYTSTTLEELVESEGFDYTYIGDWGHESNQRMALATPKK